jgi:hypothetical protein
MHLFVAEYFKNYQKKILAEIPEFRLLMKAKKKIEKSNILMKIHLNFKFNDKDFQI